MSRGTMRRLGSAEDFLGDLHPVGCPACERVFLAPTGGAGTCCPGCGVAKVAPRPALVREAMPELIVPFQASREDLIPALRTFLRGVWFPTGDMTAENLSKRAIPVWWPVWLVDAGCLAAFNAEVGFNYQVKSSDEILEGGAWKTREVLRTKIRWEPRTGAIARRYDNVVARALGEHEQIGERVGAYDHGRAVQFTVDKLAGAWVQLPDVSPDEAWPAAEQGFVAAAAAEIAEAVAAEHVRGVTLQGATFDEVNWTWLLLPLYATWYTDDSGVRRVVAFHGETGKAHGVRLASVTRGFIWSTVLALIGTAILVGAGVIGLIGLVLLPLLVVALVVAALGGVFYLAALWPPFRAWSHNRAELAENTDR